jgi:uncharacterized protein YcnI
MTRHITFAAALLGLLALPAAAHVTIDPPQAIAGSTLRAAFRVPHGCGQAATQRVVITLPEGILMARPMPKPGWTLRVREEPLATPIDNGHGGQVTKRVVEIAWEGGLLPDAWYDEFVVLLRLPATANETLWIPATQHCEGGTTAAWTEIPEPGRRVTEYRMPAPSLRLLPLRMPRDGGN